jgi:hypothetical protein
MELAALPRDAREAGFERRAQARMVPCQSIDPAHGYAIGLDRPPRRALLGRAHLRIERQKVPLHIQAASVL